MTEIAQTAGMSRQTLYRHLRMAIESLHWVYLNKQGLSRLLRQIEQYRHQMIVVLSLSGRCTIGSIVEVMHLGLGVKRRELGKSHKSWKSLLGLIPIPKSNSSQGQNQATHSLRSMSQEPAISPPLGRVDRFLPVGLED